MFLTYNMCYYMTYIYKMYIFFIMFCQFWGYIHNCQHEMAHQHQCNLVFDKG